MSEPQHNLDELLARVADGHLDELTPEQVAALAAHLDTEPAEASRLADGVPAADATLNPALPSPSEAEWKHVWDGIESAAPNRATTARTIGHVFHTWRPLVAVAACVALLVLWRLTPARVASWELQMSDNVVVHELEVFGDESAFVAYSDDEGGSAVIWVFEEDESPEGA